MLKCSSGRDTRSRAARLALMTAACVQVATATMTAADPPPENRIKQIAAWLADAPGGFGQPISDRETWETLGRREDFRALVKTAERLAQESIPDQPDDLYLDYSRTGNRTRWQSVAGQRRGRLRTFALAECIENRGRFIPPLEEIIRVLCDEPTWVMPAHDSSLANFRGQRTDIDLGSARLAADMALVDHLLGDRLADEVRTLLRNEAHKRVLDPVRAMVAGERDANWWLRTTNNWNAVCLAGVTQAALALIESRKERAFFVAAAEQYSKNFLKGFTPGGYCSEGLGYWNYGYGHFILLAEAISQATGGNVDLFELEGAREPGRFGKRIEIINGVYPAFADCRVDARPSARLMYYVCRRLGIADPAWSRLDPVSAAGGLPDTLMYSLPNSASSTPPAEEKSALNDRRTWFKGAGVLIARPHEVTDRSLAVALKGGHNAEHHNHNDVGSFVVVVGHEPLLVDPGSEVYTKRTFSGKRYDSDVLNSFGHPVPVVAGKLQRTGRQAAGGIVRTEFTDESDTLILDLKSAYPVTELETLQRTFVYSRADGGSLQIVDEVEFSQPNSFEVALVTFADWKEVEPGVLLVTGRDAALMIGIQVEGSPYTLESTEIDEDVTAKSKPIRLGIRLTNPVQTATVAVTVTPVSFDRER